jgi:hypothetical protein
MIFWPLFGSPAWGMALDPSEIRDAVRQTKRICVMIITQRLCMTAARDQ